jgi:hypothetical protein
MSTRTYPDGSASTDTVTNALGWGNYSDSEASPVTQTITTTPSKLLIDGLGGNTNTDYLPNSLAGGSDLWDGTQSLITPASVGDSYDMRINLEITAKASSPTRINVILDIGGGASPSIIVAEKAETVEKTVPFPLSVNILIFCLNTFVTNGGQIFLSTDTGSVTIASRSILLSRNYTPSA